MGAGRDALPAGSHGCSLRPARYKSRNAVLCIDNDRHKQQPAGLTNLERLKEQLAKDSLGGRLVTAAMATGEASMLSALRQVIADRLEEINRKHEHLPDQQA